MKYVKNVKYRKSCEATLIEIHSSVEDHDVVRSEGLHCSHGTERVTGTCLCHIDDRICREICGIETVWNSFVISLKSRPAAAPSLTGRLV